MMCWNKNYLSFKHALNFATISAMIHGHDRFSSKTLHNNIESTWMIIWLYYECMKCLFACRITIVSAILFVVSSMIALSAYIMFPFSSLRQNAYELKPGFTFDSPSILYLTYLFGGRSHMTFVTFSLWWYSINSFIISGQFS